jgi:Holliday junction resolvase RusA-like endonuclease
VYADSKTVSAERSLLAQALPYKPATPLEGPLMVTIEAFCAIPKSFTKAQRAGAISQALRPTGKPDVDNLAKLVLDALNGVFFADDKQVTMLIVSKRYTDGAARTGIKITEL